MKTGLPVVGITMGDPAGIGPEIIVKSLTDESVYGSVRAVVIGDKKVLQRAASMIDVACGFVDHRPEIPTTETDIEVFDLRNCGAPIRYGEVSAVNGKAAGEYIEKAYELWKNGTIDAICTAPINKASLNLGERDFPGHTEFFASLAGIDKFAMSFFAGQLRVVLLSTHVSLFEAIKLVRRQSIVDLIEFTDRTFSKLLGKKVSIAVAGLNPHASENGKFGTEEEMEITPAVDECLNKGINVSGPYSPDTIFMRAHKGEFDAVIAHYHDQATIPVKALSFGSAVNVTLGLPFIRTSVDHGTAFDIAGKGIADASSMKAAILLAGKLAAAAALEK